MGCLGLLPFLLSEVGVLTWERDLDPVADTLCSPSHPVSGQGQGHPFGRDLGLPLILPPLSLLSLLPYSCPHCCCLCPGPYEHGRPAFTWVTLGPTLFSCCLALGIPGFFQCMVSICSLLHWSPHPHPKPCLTYRTPWPSCCFVVLSGP